MNKHTVLAKLCEIFRMHGYAGTSLSLISEQTGLQRSSLYHYFPGGKEQMAAETLQLVHDTFITSLENLMATDTSARDKAEALATTLQDYYQQGHLGCILPSLTTTQQFPTFQEAAATLLEAWRSVIAEIAEQGGLSETQAQKNANQVICLVEGSLAMTKITGSNDVFLDVMQQIPELLAPQSTSAK